MASLRRSTVMPNDGASAKFLYTILKQLDHKSIDWNLVASELEITNGHAARMRFSRFKQHMEGGLPPRKARSEARQQKKLKIDGRSKKEGGGSAQGVKAEDMGLWSCPSTENGEQKPTFLRQGLLYDRTYNPGPVIKWEEPFKHESFDKNKPLSAYSYPPAATSASEGHSFGLNSHNHQQGDAMDVCSPIGLVPGSLATISKIKSENMF